MIANFDWEFSKCLAVLGSIYPARFYYFIFFTAKKTAQVTCLRCHSRSASVGTEAQAVTSRLPRLPAPYIVS